MKKNYFLIFCCITIFADNAISQSFCEKGTWIVGCNFLNYSPFNIGKNTFNQTTTLQTFSPDTLITINTSGSTKINEGSDLSLTLYVSFGYFVKDRIIVGGAMNNFIPSSVFIRYYLGQHKRKFYHLKQDNFSRFAWFVQTGLSANYNSRKKDVEPIPGSTLGGTSKSSNYSVSPKIGVGATYLITKHIALEVDFNYSFYINGGSTKNDTKIFPNGNQHIKNEGNGYSNSVAFLFGIQTYF